MDCQSHQSKQSHQVVVSRFLCNSTAHTEEEEKYVQTAREALVTSMFLVPAVQARLYCTLYFMRLLIN